MFRTLRFILTTAALVGVPVGILAGAVRGVRFLQNGVPMGLVFEVADAVNWATVATFVTLIAFVLVLRTLVRVFPRPGAVEAVAALLATAPLLAVLAVRINPDGHVAIRVGLGLFVAACLPLLKALLGRWAELASGSRRGGWAPCCAALLPVMALNLPAFAINTPDPGAGAQPNIFLIVVDRLRADRLGCYGYRGGTSPGIDSFSKTATIFGRAISSGTFVTTSLASIVASRHPFQHGVYEWMADVPESSRRLAERHVTLAEMLRDHAYLTMAWVSDPALWAPGGIAQGFVAYDSGQRSPAEINARVARWIPRMRGRRPLFVYLHYRESGERVGLKQADGSTRDEQRHRYDASVSATDRALAELFSKMKSSGVYEESLIVLTSDRGEELTEHESGAGLSLPYDELLWVPLIVKLPAQNRAGRTVTSQVSHVDLLPTILDVAGIRSSERTEGCSLAPLIGLASRSEPLYPRCYSVALAEGMNRPGRRAIAVRTPHFKYIYTEDGRREFYDLQRDPDERSNIVDRPGDERDLLGHLALRAATSRGRLSYRSWLDAESMGRLDALGLVR